MVVHQVLNTIEIALGIVLLYFIFIFGSTIEELKSRW